MAATGRKIIKMMKQDETYQGHMTRACGVAMWAHLFVSALKRGRRNGSFVILPVSDKSRWCDLIDKSHRGNSRSTEPATGLSPIATGAGICC